MECVLGTMRRVAVRVSRQVTYHPKCALSMYWIVNEAHVAAFSPAESLWKL